MPTLYFSLCSENSEPLVQKIAAECEAFLEAECVLAKAHEAVPPEKIRESLKGKKVSITVSGGNITLDQLTEAVKVYQKSVWAKPAVTAIKSKDFETKAVRPSSPVFSVCPLSASVKRDSQWRPDASPSCNAPS